MHVLGYRPGSLFSSVRITGKKQAVLGIDVFPTEQKKIRAVHEPDQERDFPGVKKLSHISGFIQTHGVYRQNKIGTETGYCFRGPLQEFFYRDTQIIGPEIEKG
jgi:hypothetical protein